MRRFRDGLPSLTWQRRTRHRNWTRKGRKRDGLARLRDTMIAGIVLASHANLATRNVKHFEDIAASVVNPWEKS